jgi:C_GCAxxG_C_C family probable redox protein
MSRKQKALAFFQEGYNCAQSILTVFRKETGMDLHRGLRLAAPFGGGVSHTGGLCGAASGAIMVIGLLRGTALPGDSDEKEQVFALTREFLTRFQTLGGAITCRELLGCGIETPEALERASENGVFERVCHPLVTGATEILESMLL